METSSTYPKSTFLRFFYTLLFVPLLLFSPGWVEDVVGQDQKRTYANFQGTYEAGVNLGLVLLTGEVSGVGNAIDGNVTTHSTLSVPVGIVGLLSATQYLEFTTDGNHSNVRTIAAGTPVTIKSSFPAEVLGLLSGIEIGYFSDLTAVGPGLFNRSGYNTSNRTGEYSGAALLNLLNGTGQFELTFAPDDDYQGVYVALSGNGLSVLLSNQLFHAYIYEDYIYTNCEEKHQPVDVLHGTRSAAVGALTTLGGVTNPYNILNSDYTDYATMTVGVGALNTIYLNTVFPTPSDPGQVVRVVVEEPGSLLDLSVLSSFSIQPYNRDAAVGSPIAANGSLISARLLPGTQKYELAFGVDDPFDRVELRFDNTITALTSLRVYEVSRLPRVMVIEDPTELANTLTGCGSVNLLAAITNYQPDYYDYHYYTTSSGGTALPSSTVDASGTYYVEAVDKVTGCKSPRVAVKATVNEYPVITFAPAQTTFMIAPGGSVTLPVPSVSNVATTSIQWYDYNGNAFSPSGAINFPTAGIYTYYVVATSTETCQSAAAVVVIVNDDGCPPAFTRTYATTQSFTTTSLLGINLGSVVDAADAADGDVSTYSTINETLNLLGLTGESSQTLNWDTDVNAGTPVTVKLARDYSVASVIGGIYVVPVDGAGAEIGPRVSVDPNLAAAVNGLNVFEHTFIPTGPTGVATAYRGVKVVMESAVNALQSIRVYDAYYHNTGTADCSGGDVVDVFGGYEAPLLNLNLASGLIGVINAGNAVDRDLSTAAIMRNIAGVAALSKLEVAFGTPSIAGDSLQIILGEPGSLLDIGLLDGLYVQRFFGNVPIEKPQAVDGSLLRLQLLSSGTSYSVIAIPTSVPYDRVRITYGGVANVVTELNVFEVSRKAATELPGTSNPESNSLEICQGELIDLSGLPTDCGATYLIYDAPFGGSLLDDAAITALGVGTHTLWIQPVRYGCASLARGILTVTVTEPLAKPVLDPTGTVVIEDGDAITIDITNTYPAGTTYKWFKDGMEISGETAANLTVSNFDASNMGDYTVQAIGVCASPLSDAVRLTLLDVDIWKSADQIDVSGGEEITYAIHIRNNTTVPITGLIVRDDIPANTTYVDASADAGGRLSGASVLWDDIDVAANSTTTLTLKVLVDEDLTDVAEISNIALVRTTPTGTDMKSWPPNATNDGPDESGPNETIIPVSPDKSIVAWKSYKVGGDATITSVTGGEEIEYTIHVRNEGNQDLTGLTIADPIPTGTTHVGGGTVSGSNVVFGPFDLGFGQTKTFTFKVKVNGNLTGVTVISNTAEVTVPGEPTVPSYPPVDNTTPTQPDETAPPETNIDVNAVRTVTFTKVGRNEVFLRQAAPGDVITYTFTVTNTGNKNLQNLVITDPLLSANVTFEPTGSNGTLNGATWEFAAGNLAVGASTTATLVVDIASPLVDIAETVISNTATLNFVDENNAPLPPQTVTDNLPMSCTPVLATDITADNTESCVGKPITLTASYDPTSLSITNARFVWYVDGNEIGRADADGAGVASIDYTFTQAGSIEVELFLEGDDACFQTPGKIVEVDVEAIPTLPTVMATANDVCEGDDVTLTASGGGLTYQWYKDGAVLIGETANTLVLTGTVTADAGVYTVRALTTNGCESSASLPIEITVNPVPVQPTITPDGPTTLCAGGYVILESSDAGTGGTYAWYINDGTGPQLLTGETQRHLVATQSGEYAVVVTNASGCTSVVSAIELVTINPAPTIEITSGSLTHVVETGITVNVPTYVDETGVSYQWYNSNGTNFSGTSFGPFADAGTYVYTLVATIDATGCQSSVTVIINVYNPGDCPPVYNRVYNDAANGGTVASLLGIPIGSVTGATNAASSDVTTYSQLSETLGISLLGLTGETSQTLSWNTQITAGTPVSVKLGKQFTLAQVIGGLHVVAVDGSGNPVSKPMAVENNIAYAAGGLNVFEYTFVPVDDNNEVVDYQGVKVYLQSLIGALQTFRIYNAYYHEQGTPDCDEDNVRDVLHGVENPISGVNALSALVNVDNPWDAVDGDETTAATLNNLVGANEQARLEILYNTPVIAGDRITIKIRHTGALVAADVLKWFVIQPYMGAAPVGDVVEENKLLEVNILTDDREAEVTFIADRPFDRIKILYGGIASVLSSLEVLEITRTLPAPELGPGNDNKFVICEGSDIDLTGPNDCTFYRLYDAPTGGNVVDVTKLTGTGSPYTYYVQAIRFGACEVGERAPVEIMVNALPGLPVANDKEVCETPTTADELYDVSASDADHELCYYESETATTPLTAVPNVDTSIPGLYTVYVSQVNTITGCEGPRVAVTVEVIEILPPVLTVLEQTFCEIDNATVVDLNADGGTGVIWYSAATGGTPLADTDALASGTYYAAQVVDGCESVDRTAVEVTITETPAPTLTNLEQAFCEIDVPTVADLDDAGATGEVVWYTAATGGTALATDAALTTGTYYAAQIGDNCESVDRTAVEVTITETPAPTLTELEQTFCEIDMPTVGDLNDDGATGEVVWYTAATGGTALTADVALTTDTYYAAQIGDNCESVDRTAVEVIITETPAPTLTELEQTFCEIDVPTVADLDDAGATGEVVWYTAATGGTPLAVDAALTTGTYYAAQIGDNCESVDRTAVEVTITETPAPTLTELEQTFCEIDMPTVADLNDDGATGDVIWYTAVTGGTPLATDVALTTGTYYAAQMGDDCESVDRTAVEVIVTETSAPTIENATPEFCESDNMTLADLPVVGTGIKWYASATFTEVLPETTVLEDGVTYYATQMGDECESAERLAVTPVITDCSSLLSITKTADADRATAGESISFTLTITNEGPGVMHSGGVIKLGERPSNGLTITGYEVTSGNGTAEGTGNTATVTTSEDIAVGGAITLTVTADVDVDAPETVSNGIDVWGPDKDPETDPKDDDGDTPPIPVDRESNLSITKEADEARVKAGESTSFTLTITNDGPSVIEVGKNIRLTERPGDGVTITGYEVASGAATIAGDGNTAVLTTTGEIAVGGTIVVSVSADVAANAGEIITNGIDVWGPAKDPDTDPKDDEDDTPPIPVDHNAGLSITKVADEARVRAGESTSFTLTLTNNGPAIIASGKVISLTERPGNGVAITGYEVTSGNGTANGSGNNATVTTSSAIAVGGTVVVKVTADIAADAGETITNGISVWGPDKDPETDPEDDEDDTPPIPVDHVSALSVTKVADDERVLTGGTTSFTVTVTNNGPATIAVGETIAVEERPGNGISITGYEVTSGNAAVNGTGNRPQLTTTAAVAAGGTITFTVSADVTAPAGSTISNGIAVWGPDKDPGTDDEDDEDETPEIPVERPYTLSIEKTADQSLVIAGESTTFTVTITNNGPLDIEAGESITLRERPGTGVTITGYEIISGAATVSGTGNTATLTTTGVVGVGTVLSVRITADVAETAMGTITNGISVWGPDRNPDTDDPDDEDDTNPIPVDATLHIPNVFTPNGDGLNDRFVIKNLLQYQGRELTVINRWGNQVYKSDNYNNDWDGGSLAEGTYYYILRYRNGSDWKTAKGPIAIIRVTNR